MSPLLLPVAGALLIAFSTAPGPVTPAPREPALRAEREAAAAQAGEELYALALNAFRDELYGAAIEGFRRYLAREPQGPHAPSARYLLGEAYRLSGDRGAALGAYGELIERHPSSGFVDGARLRRGILFFQANRFAEALGELEHVRSAESRPQALFWQGQSLLRLGRLREALKAFTGLRALNPESPLARRARFYEAIAHRRAGEREEAVKGFRAFLEKEEEPSLRGRARWELARALLEGQRWGQAGRQLEILLRESPSRRGGPTRGRLLLALAQVRYREKKFRKAAVHFAKALKEPLGKEERRLSLRGLAESSQAAGAHAEAARAFRELLSDGKVAPSDPLWSKALRSYVAADLCRPAEAPFLEHIEKKTSAHLGADGLYLMGRCLESMGATRRAVAHYLRLEKAHPGASEAPWALFRAGKLLLRGGQLEEGLKRLLSFAERHPKSPLAPRAILLAAQTLFRSKRYGEVLASLPRERTGRWPEAYETLAARLRAETLLNLGRFREALAPLREVLSRKGELGQKARAGYLLGLAHYKLGEWREARRSWGERIEGFPPAFRQEALFLSLLAAVREGAREETVTLARKLLGLPKLPPERGGRAAFELSLALVKLGKVGEAEKVLEARLQDFPRGEPDRAARLLLAGLLYERKGFVEVVPLLREWLAHYEGQEGETRALLLLAQSEVKRGKKREAAKLLDRLLDRHPRVPERRELLLQLGRLYDGLGERGRALFRYRAYLDEVGSSKQGAGVALRAGELLLEEGKVEDAIRAWEDAAARDAGSVSLQARYRLGELYLRRGEEEKALAAFSAAARAGAPSAESWGRAAALRAGALEEEKGRWKEALAFYRLAAAGGASGVEGEKARERVRRIEAYLRELEKARPKDGGRP